MGTILGIDADTFRIAFCVLETDGVSYRVAKHGEIQRRAIKKRDTRGIQKYAATYSDDLRGLLHSVAAQGGKIYLEDVFLGHNRKTYRLLSHVQAEILYEVEGIFKYPGIVDLVQPRAWQSMVGAYNEVSFMQGEGTKEASMRCATKIAGFIPESSHVADAVCIAFFGHMVRFNASKSEEKKTKGILRRKRKAHSSRRIRKAV